LESTQQHFLVIGAGIVGVSTALWLQRMGQKVTLVDRTAPAAGTSYGNAGVLAAGSIVPVTVPGLLAKAPRMLLDPNKPLFLRWTYLPKLMKFLPSYLKNSSRSAVERISDGLHALLHDTYDQHKILADDTLAAQYLTDQDYLFGYADKSAFVADDFGWGLRRARGVEHTEIDADAMAAFDPALAGRFGYGVICHNHGAIKDPGEYVIALANTFIAQGGTFLEREAQDFELIDGKCDCLMTDHGMIKADQYILTTGAWSSAWAKQFGITVGMESERGYHIEFVNPSITLRSPIMVAGGKFVVNSMNGRMRCAGVIEFGGLDAGPSKAPIELLKKQMAALFPDMTYDRIDEWMGHRPATTDSLPVIGRAPNAENILLGYGHHHVGLTGGPKTGRWLAQLATGKQINTDLSVFAADR
jgi:D-amino-acid dehydrogenase